jgi:hypothetical protein
VIFMDSFFLSKSPAIPLPGCGPNRKLLGYDTLMEPDHIHLGYTDYSVKYAKPPSPFL